MTNITSDEYVTCLVDGSLHFEITSTYLRSLGWTLAKYKRTYPEAKLKAKRSYQKSLSDDEIEYRRETMRQKVKDPAFQANRRAALKAYWASIRSTNERRLRAGRTQWQHVNTDIEEKLKEHFENKKSEN